MNNTVYAPLTQKRERLGLPFYTIGEEIANCITHLIGAVAGLLGGVLLISKASGALEKTASAIFVVTLVALYLNSAVYHGAKVDKAKKYLQILDHCTIFLLIAGTYTPYTLITLKGVWGYSILAAVWTTAIVGIVLNIIDLKKYSKVSMLCYLLMGWCIIAASSQLFNSLAPAGIVLLLTGGVAYTIGAVLYGFGKKIRYMHSVWHIFVLAGSVLHFLSIYFYVIG